MKKFFLTAAAMIALSSTTVFTACDNDDPKPEQPVAPAEAKLSGKITTAVTLNANTVYTLEGAVVVEKGGVLTIPAGTVIKVRKGFENYLLVAQGGRLNAEGTAAKPITFTADVDGAKAGYWGGIIMNGLAPISGAQAGTTGKTEIDNSYIYGGTNADDNSGVLSHVKILYSGAKNSADVEHHGLTLNAVGGGTKINNIYVYECADDGIELFGGSVDVSNVLCVNTDDDMFDTTQGYTGTMRNLYGVWEAQFTSTEKDPRGVEADGNLDGKTPNDVGQSDFRIEAITIENNATTSTTMLDAIKVRRGAKANIVNALVKGAGQVKNLVDLTDKAGAAHANTGIRMTNALQKAISGKELVGEGDVKVEQGLTGANFSAFGWTGYKL